MTQFLPYHDNDVRSIYVHFRGRPLGEGVSGGPLIRLALETRDERIELTNLTHAPPATKTVPKRQRKPSIHTLIRQAEKAGKPVSSVTTPDGITLRFGESEPTEAVNPWLADLPKATRQ